MASTALASDVNVIRARRAPTGAWRSRISDCFAVFAARNDKKLIGWIALGAFFVGIVTGALPFLAPAFSGKFPVEVRVDFGPAGKPALTQTLEVDGKTTPKEAVSLVLPVMSGKTCSSIHDLLEIDGVRPDATENLWWVLTINGSRNVSPYRTHLKKGDLVEWRYLKEIEGEKSGKERKP